jgi:hypothetical protein
MNPNDVLGVDIGQVLIEQYPVDASLSFRGPNYLSSPEMPDAFRVLRRLREERFGERIFLITRCGKKLRDKRVEWLDKHDFYQRVGIPRVPPRYCWTPHNKSHVCHDLGVTHFIDDDPRELVHLCDLVSNLVLFRPSKYADEYARFIEAHATRVETWNEIEKLLLP